MLRLASLRTDMVRRLLWIVACLLVVAAAGAVLLIHRPHELERARRLAWSVRVIPLAGPAQEIEFDLRQPGAALRPRLAAGHRPRRPRRGRVGDPLPLPRWRLDP